MKRHIRILNGPLFILFFLSIIVKTFSQQITVVNESTGVAVENVALFNKEKKVSVISNDKGIADISEFNNTDTIYFQHPSFEIIGLQKSDLNQGSVVRLKSRYILMDEFVISAHKDIERKRELPFMIDVLEPSTIFNSGYQTAADLLMETGNIIIQKSQGGGGSPILRGFEANKILLVVDGIRMNNAIYRNGHLQNAITIDNQILERVEVIFGPSSVIYGSDALGGVIHYYTKDPKFSDLIVQSYVQFSTANRSQIIHTDLNYGKTKIGNLTSITVSDYGDIRSGSKRKPEYGDWGLATHYVTQVNGVDSTMINPQPDIQIRTGYRQYDFLNKFKYSPSYKLDLIFNLQISASSNVDRFDQLNDYAGDNLKYAEWYYGPQNRFMGAIQSVFKQYNKFFTNFTSTFAFQKIDEDRITRRFRIDDQMHQEEDVYVYSANLDFIKIFEENRRLLYGLEYTHNDVLSDAYYKNIRWGTESVAITRYPGGGSHTNSLSLYANYKWSFDSKYILHTGLRYNYDYLQSAFTDPGLPFDEIKINNGALTGSISLVYHPAETWQCNLITSTGFRNPNVDDYGKVRAKGDFITVPNNDLKPEYTYNIEFSTSKVFPGYLKINGTFFYSYLTNAIVRTDHTLNGSDSLFYDGIYYKIITNSNASLAEIKGVSFSLISDLQNSFSFKSTLNLLDGKDISDHQPLGHISPLFGRTSFSYRHNKLFGEAYVLYSGQKHIKDMSPYGEDNENEGLEGEGFPAWYTINLKTTYTLNNYLELQVGLENLLDRFYKPFASGVAAPGRNFLFTIRANI